MTLTNSGDASGGITVTLGSNSGGYKRPTKRAEVMPSDFEHVACEIGVERAASIPSEPKSKMVAPARDVLPGDVQAAERAWVESRGGHELAL